MKKTNILLIILLIAAVILFININSYAQVTQEWVARYNSYSTQDDVPYGIVVDKFGNSYVTGTTSTPGRTIVTTVKYNTQGVMQWVKVYFDSSMPENYPSGIVIDSSANIYIAGYSGNINTSIYYTWTKKYNTNGDSIWTRYYYGTNSVCQPEAIKGDKAGNTYITGGSYGPQIFTIKYNSNGDSLWTRTYKQSGYFGSYSQSIAVDVNSNVYVGGVSWFSPSNKYDYQIIKYNASGTLLWATAYGEANYDEFCYKIAVDNNSNVYMTGSQYRPATDDDYLTVKYNSTGTFQWARTFGRGPDNAYNIITDYSGNIIVTGRSGVFGIGYNYGTIKYTPAGDSQWVRIYSDTTSSPYDIAYSMIADSSNNIYINGRGGISGPATTIKYSSNGIQQWKISYPIGSSAYGNSLAIDNSRNIYITGSDFDFVIVKYSQLVGVAPVSTEIPKQFNLHQNYPNPFNSQTIIEFDINEKSDVNIDVLDILGRHITNLLSEQLNTGKYNINWNAESISSGTYFCVLNAVSTKNNKVFNKVIKMILLK